MKEPRKTRVRKPAAEREAPHEVATAKRLMLYGIIMHKNSNEAMSAMLGYGRRIPGTQPKWPDQAVYGPGKRHALLEFKPPGWKPRNTDEREHFEGQLECHERLRALGHDVAVVHDQDEAVAQLKAWGWPVP